MLSIAGGLLLATGGISIARSPEHEVIYSLGAPQRFCAGDSCTIALRLELGNTGTAVQETVRVRLRRAPLEQASLPVTIRNFGKVDRPVAVTEDEETREYDLGRLEPQKRVEIAVTYWRKAGEPAPAWEDVFVAIDPGRGDARPGYPAGVLFLRMLHAFFGWL